MTISITPIIRNDESSSFDFDFEISIDQILPFDVFVDWQTVPGSAFEDIDYNQAGGTAQIVAGTTSTSIRVDNFSDSVLEGDENFYVELTNPVGDTFADDALSIRGLGIILDNEGENRPVVFVNDVRIVEGDGGARQAVFDIALSRSFAGDVFIPFTTVDGSATAGEDYVATSGTVPFLAGATEATVTVDITGDTAIEASETFSLVLDTSGINVANPAAQNVGVATILDDDAGGVRPTVSIQPIDGLEVSSDLQTFVVTLSSATSADVTIDWETRNGSAFEDIDLDRQSGTLTIAAGDTTGFISINPFSDSEIEGDENYFVALTNATNARFAGGAGELTSMGVIIDNDGENRPALFVGDAVVVEGVSGTRQAIFDVRLSRAFETDVVIPFSTISDSARDGGDFTGVSGDLTLLAGQTETKIVVDILGDTAVENTERFALALDTSSLDLANGADGSVGIGTILDDDAGAGAVPVISIEGVRQPEVSGDPLEFVVRLSAPSTSDVTVDFRTLSGTADKESDFDERFQTLTILAGDTSARIGVSPFSDSVLEGDESLSVLLTNATNARFAGNAT
ncbi:MAG: Calx-beta domain-containing protein, partial [Pseudomonadota bacterium]